MSEFNQTTLVKRMPIIWLVGCALWLLAFYAGLMFQSRPVLAVTIGGLAPICAFMLAFGTSNGPAALQLFFLLQWLALACLGYRSFTRDQTRWTMRKIWFIVVVALIFLGTTALNHAITTFGD